MSVVYGSPEGLAFVCAVYVCGCGRRATQYARGVAQPPPGWVAQGEGKHACPDCARSG